jgi:hypothetical protein
MLGWHETVMVRASCRKVLLGDSDTVLGIHRDPALLCHQRPDLAAATPSATLIRC